MYFTDAGPASGALLYRDALSPLPVRRGRGGPTVGSAKCVGWLDGDLALYRLRVDDADLPGLWIVVDREFRPA